MPVPASIDDLLKLIRKSGMVDEPRLEAYLEKHRQPGSMTTDVKKLAGSMVKDGMLTYFQAEQFLLGKWRGFTIGKYKLLERIGFGGMGQVFLCEHMYMRRRVAIKVLPPAKAEEPAALGRFYREARAAAALDHPNIVRTHDIDQDGNLHFLVMEYVDGSSLLDIVKKIGPMSIKRAIHYTWQSIQGLDHAYKVGVIHRDIKPGNILVDRFGTAKILDMGLARFYNADDDMLTLKYDEKSVLGTADYVAPEQTVNSHNVDVRADIYALGATFYYLLAGHPPFPDGTIAQKLIAHQTREPTSIRQLRPEVPVEIEVILKKMLAKSVEDRYRVPEEIYQALMPYVDQQVAVPPDDEMPILSPAAREQSMGSPSSMSGSFRQDSAILRAGIQQRSGSMAKPQSGRIPQPAPIVPPVVAPSKSDSSPSVAVLPPSNHGGGGSGSSTIKKPFFEGPPENSGPAPAAPNVRPTTETKRLASTTDRTPINEPPRPPVNPPIVPVSSTPAVRRDEFPLEPSLFSNPIVRILSEALVIFSLALLLLWIYVTFFQQ